MLPRFQGFDVCMVQGMAWVWGLVVYPIWETLVIVMDTFLVLYCLILIPSGFWLTLLMTSPFTGSILAILRIWNLTLKVIQIRANNWEKGGGVWYLPSLQIQLHWIYCTARQASEYKRSGSGLLTGAHSVLLASRKKLNGKRTIFLPLQKKLLIQVKMG